MKISPIFYMGNKKKLINKGLIDLFPEDINTFIELFAGSGVVSMNVQANNYMVNDINVHLKNFYTMFKLFNAEHIIYTVNKYIEEFGLAKERTKRNEFKDKDKIEKYKQAYFNIRDDYNTRDNNIFKLYTLMFYAFSQQMRFNSKNKFNMPCGNDCFSEKNKIYIQNGCNFFRQANVEIFNEDFKQFNLLDFNFQPNDFVYLDPPYFNTTATYNENNGWTEDDETILYQLCEELNNKGVKWGMSNVFENKGCVNKNLIDWCNSNNWKVYTFDKFTYMACGKGNSNAQEVYICNY